MGNLPLSLSCLKGLYSQILSKPDQAIYEGRLQIDGLFFVLSSRARRGLSVWSGVRLCHVQCCKAYKRKVMLCKFNL